MRSRTGCRQPLIGPGSAVRMLNVPSLSSTIAVTSDSCAWPAPRATCRSSSADTRPCASAREAAPSGTAGWGCAHESLEAFAAGATPGDAVLHEEQHGESRGALGQSDRLGRVQLGQRPLSARSQHHHQCQVRCHAHNRNAPQPRPAVEQDVFHDVLPAPVEMPAQSHPMPRHRPPAHARRPNHLRRCGSALRLSRAVRCGNRLGRVCTYEVETGPPPGCSSDVAGGALWDSTRNRLSILPRVAGRCRRAGRGGRRRPAHLAEVVTVPAAAFAPRNERAGRNGGRRGSSVVPSGDGRPET